jgi:hypothetical protein
VALGVAADPSLCSDDVVVREGRGVPLELFRSAQNSFYSLQVFFGVYSYGVVGGLDYVDVDSVFEEA